MDLTSEQRDLRDAVRALLERHPVRPASDAPHTPAPRSDGPSTHGPSTDAPTSDGPSTHGPGDGRGYEPRLWRRLCGEIGVAGLAIPERYGGAGAGPVETHIVMEELGRCLVPAPMLGSAVLAAQALLASGDAAACERLLPGIAAGTTIAALAWTGADGRWDPEQAAYDARPAPPSGSPLPSADSPPPSADSAPPSPGSRPPSADSPRPPAGSTPPTSADPPPHISPSGGWALTGEAHYVLDGDTAGVLLAAARTPDGVALFEVDPDSPGVTRRAVMAMDTTRRLAVVTLDGAAGRPIGHGARGLARARDLACIALSAEQSGAAQRALELTVAYTKTRVQFGRPIGSFQALQHRMADLHVLVESARSLSYAAAAAAAADAPGLGTRAAAAKAHSSEALARTAAEMIQMHGAIGITWEHDAHRYFKRAHGSALLLGRTEDHVARVAAALIDT